MMGVCCGVRAFAFFCILLAVEINAWAHMGWDARTTVHIFPDRMQLVVRMMPPQAWLLLKEKAPPAFDDEAFKVALPMLKARGATLFEVQSGTELLQPKSVRISVERDDNVAWLMEYAMPTQWPLRLKAALAADIGPDFKATVSIIDQSKSAFPGDAEPSAGTVLTAGDLTMEVPRPAGLAQTPAAAAQQDMPVEVVEHPGVFPKFLRLGIGHILTGYDHLLFLLALLVGCRRVKPMLGIITGFTLAHSLTLALAAMDVVRLKSSIVEPLIAASIVIVGIENLVWSGTAKGRWQVACAFGLIHGFGFASALREVGLGANGSPVLAPLVSFNLGVEIGQIAVAAFVLPLLFGLRKLHVGERYALPAISCMIVLAGGYWLLERTLFWSTHSPNK
jgi:hypothetical protein